LVGGAKMESRVASGGERQCARKKPFNIKALVALYKKKSPPGQTNDSVTFLLGYFFRFFAIPGFFPGPQSQFLPWLQGLVQELV
jgi:hypothetical protein